MSYDEAGFSSLLQKLSSRFSEASPSVMPQFFNCTRLMMLDFSMLAFGVFHVLLVNPSPGTASPSKGSMSHSVPFSLLHGYVQGSSSRAKTKRQKKYCAF